MESDSPQERDDISEDGDDSPFEEPIEILKQPLSTTERLKQMITNQISKGETGMQLMTELEDKKE